MKRLMDVAISSIALVAALPVILVFMYLVYRHDNHSPFYVASRVGKHGILFNMYKLRSMRVNADRSGVDSTSSDDDRITPIGHKIRRYKLDEVVQLWNVLIGDMSLVGPRPNVLADTALYTDIEKGLLTVRPGVTDFSSIVFSDEGDILEGRPDPDLSYNQLIRPWKSRLGLIYIEKQSLSVDLKIILYTVVAIASKERALNWIGKQLEKYGVDPAVVEIASRKADLYPFPPPGSECIVTSREA